MTAAIAVIINVVLMAAIVLVLAGGHLWALVTQHRDHGVLAAGPVLRRTLWSRPRRAHAGSRRPIYGPRRQPLLDA